MLQSKLRQIILEYTDYFLSLVEKCMEWSLPEQNIEDEKESRKMELVRPLPWLLFLPCLMMLSLIRMIVNIGAFIFNYPKIMSSEMQIKFVQKHRRYLHDAMKKDKKEKCKLKITTSKEKLEEKPKERSEEKSVVESIDSMTLSKHSMSESEDEKEEEKEKEEREETLIEKINRLSLENSEDDEDFQPDKYFSSDMSSNDENSNDENSTDENSNVSSNEIHDIIKDEFNEKIIEQFLNAEQTFTLASNQKLVEPTCEKRSSAKKSRDKVEEHFATLQRIDSLECCTSDKSSQEGNLTFYSPVSSDSDNDIPKDLSVSIAKQCVSRKILKTKEFINGEALFSASMISDSESKQTNNDTIVEKHSTNMSKSHKGKHTSHRKKKIARNNRLTKAKQKGEDREREKRKEKNESFPSRQEITTRYTISHIKRH